jgi:hypothetical protein
MKEKILCEKCGHEMKSIDENIPVGKTCANCGWGWVTTYIEPILSDTTTYCLTIRKMNSPDAKVLRVLASILNCNYIKAKEQVTTQDVEITDRAAGIKEYAITLAKNDIPFDIKPDFPYEIQ